MESCRKRKQLYQLDHSDSDSESSTSTDSCTLKRCKTEDTRGGVEQKSCHQCKRNDKGNVVSCSKCERKRYCTSCISKNYHEMTEEDFVKACPFCRDICNCKSCLRLELPEKNKIRLSKEDKVHYSKYLLKRLFPFVRQFNEQQILEREMEAKIRGLSLSDVEVQVANCPIDERMNCDYCRTSIADYHRSCTQCPYDLCIACCRDLRDGCLHARQMEGVQYKNPGVGYLHGETCKPVSNRTVGTFTESKDGASPKAEFEWKPNKDGSISCPPKSIGGCGKGILKLNQVLPDDWLSNMLAKAEKLYKLYKLNDMPETPAYWCSTFNNAKRKAASRDNSNDNYLYSPSAIDIQAENLECFQAHWSRGEPVIVSSVLDSTYGLSWEPMVMSRAIRDKSQTDVTVLNCLNWCEEEYSVSSFFKGYTEGILDLSDWPQMLKLNDWPPSGLFGDHLPRHNMEFISALPFKEYTHPQSSYFNLAVKLPSDHLMPDTGPKLYTAYGCSQQLGRGDSVTKINYNDSDVVYVLMHNKEMTLSHSELAKIEHLKEKHHLQDQKEIYVDGKMGNGLEQQKHDDIEESENPESGALWDIYRRADALKLKKYLRKHFREFRHTYCLPLKQVVDPVYDGTFYLNTEHKRRLKKEYGIEPWTVMQNLGDAVLIPAGCPFQVRNLKSCIQVSTGFVSPESINACLRFTEEIRVLPQDHVAKEDKLGVNKLLLYAMRQVLDDLEVSPKTEAKTDYVDISSDSSKESGYLGSEPANLETESNSHPAMQKVYSRCKSKNDRRGLYSLIRDPTSVQRKSQKEANISQKVSHYETVQPISSDDSPGSYIRIPRIVPKSGKEREFVDISPDSSKESGYLKSSGFNPESDFNAATQNVYARSPSKDQSRLGSLRCDTTPIESDFQKEADMSQEVSDVLTKTVKSSTSNDSPGSYSQAPRSVSAEMVGFFNQLEEQIQEEKLDVLKVLPPQIHLDEEIIQEYEKILKKHMSGRLLDLANDSNLQDFNKVLHFLLASRRIPSHLQQGFLTLRSDLPNLTSRVYELHKEVHRGMIMPLARSKEREELKTILGKYRQVEDNLVKLEKEKDGNMLVIARLQMRNEHLNKEVTSLKGEVAKNVVGGSGNLCNDQVWKLEQKKDYNSDEIVRLEANNEAIGAKIINFADEAKMLHKDANAQHYKVINLEAMAAVYEGNVENAMDRLVLMELKWKQRVESLDY